MAYKKVELPKLDFGYDALEPILSEQQISNHHKFFHKEYVEVYNKLLDQIGEAKSGNDINKIKSLTKDIQFNLGAHIYHCLYWKNLSPCKIGCDTLPKDSTLIKKIIEQWGSFENFKKYFIEQIMKIKGSGWGNLVYNKIFKCLEYIETKDQDIIFLQKEYVFILCIDGWEHAWSFQYINDKEKYYNEIWKIIN